MDIPKTKGLIFLYLVLCAYIFAAPIELAGGKLKLVLYPDTGSFSLLQLSDVGKNRYEPLFEDRNSSTTSWFSVLVNGRIFKLERKIGKPIVAEKILDGARFVFTLTDDFQVEQSFSFVNDTVTGTPYAVRVKTRVENTSGKTGVFALKAVIDTMLGESEGIHFFTNIQKRISAETRIAFPQDRDSLIVSQNKALSCMFLLQNNLVTQAESVYVSNWDRLNTLTWTPEFIEGRSFNTLYSVNDSALLFIWPEKTLTANEKLEVNMIIGSYTPEFAGSSTASNIAEPASSSKQMLVQQLLARIAEIEKKPDSASDEELRKLNEALDLMLKQIKE